MNLELALPRRTCKPRHSGLTVLIDNGVPYRLFMDTIESASGYIDFVKFGWGTSVVTPTLRQKIACLFEHNVDYFFGGTLFEKCLAQNKLDDYIKFCKQYKASYVEISNGTLPISNKEKAGYIREFSKHFYVFSEVGHKDPERAGGQSSADWVDAICEDMEAGAYKVITEARESGTSGICSKTGELRMDVVEEILQAGIHLDAMIFEAPNKNLQTSFIKIAGPNVNLANIPFSDPIPLETLRLGLRSDTFFAFQAEEAAAAKETEGAGEAAEAGEVLEAEEVREAEEAGELLDADAQLARVSGMPDAGSQDN